MEVFYRAGKLSVTTIFPLKTKRSFNFVLFIEVKAELWERAKSAGPHSDDELHKKHGNSEKREPLLVMSTRVERKHPAEEEINLRGG